MNLLFIVFGEKFKFQAEDSFSEYFFLEIWRSKKRIALSEKKPPLIIHFHCESRLLFALHNCVFFVIHIEWQGNHASALKSEK